MLVGLVSRKFGRRRLEFINDRKSQGGIRDLWMCQQDIMLTEYLKKKFRKPYSIHDLLYKI